MDGPARHCCFAAVRAAVLVPVFRRLQRQFPQNVAGLPHPVQERGRRRRRADHAGERHLHRAVFRALGPRRRIADCHDKARVAQRVKFVEIFVAGLSAAGFLLASLPLMFAALAGFGILGALFGPVKYGILPDHLPVTNCRPATRWSRARLSSPSSPAPSPAASPRRNSGDVSVLRAGDRLRRSPHGRCAVHPPSGDGAPHLRVRLTSSLRRSRCSAICAPTARLWWGALVTSWFWLVGIVVLSLLPPLIKNLIGGNEDTVTLISRCSPSRSAIGSALAARLRPRTHRARHHRRRRGAARRFRARSRLGDAGPGAGRGAARAGRGTSASALGLRAAIDLCGLAIAGGLFIVPAFAAVQAWSDAAYRARTIAGVNVLNAGFMTAATVVVALCRSGA